MNILIVANHYAVCSARYATAAFERLGHTVKHIGPAMGRNIWGLTLPERYVWEPSEISDFSPDIMICMDSDPAILDWCNGDQSPDVFTIVWGVDSHVRDYRRPHFGHYFLAHKRSSLVPFNEYFYIGGQLATHPEKPCGDVTHLPCAYDPEYFTPSAIPFEERKYDVACLGVIYPQRMQVINALKDAGFSVIWGMGLVYEAFAEAYQNARISLCISSNGDVAQRVFETARMGNVVMTDNCPDFQLLKPDGVWLLDDTEPDTVVQAVKDVLHEPEHAQAMIAQSMAWAEPHSWDEGARKVVGWYERR